MTQSYDIGGAGLEPVAHTHPVPATNVPVMVRQVQAIQTNLRRIREGSK